MKAKIALLLTALLPCSLPAAPLTETVAVRLKPDAALPAYAYLKAGTEPAPAAGTTAPEGWMAVELPGPHEGYVLSKDFTKAMDPKAGAAIYSKPDTNSPVLTIAAHDDKTEVTGLTGKWLQIKLDRGVVGYYQTAAHPAPGAGKNSGNAGAILPPPPPATPASPAPAANDGSPSVLSRQFTGTLVLAKKLLGPRPAYPYQLNDANGSRLAYLDLGKVLQTQQVESYVGQSVVVFGTARNLPESKTIVIVVESIQAL